MSISAPTDLASCQVWFDAEDATTMDSSGGLTYSWVDKKNSLGITPQTGKPMAIHDYAGKRVLQVMGRGGQVRADGVAPYMTGESTIVAAVCPLLTVASGGRWSYGASKIGTPGASIFRFGSNTNFITVQRANDAGVTRTLQSTSGQAHNRMMILTVVCTATAMTMWIDGVQIATGSISGSCSVNAFAFGGYGDTSTSPADPIIAGLVVCNSALGTTDRQDLEAYMAARHKTTRTNELAWPSTWTLENLPKLAIPTLSGSTCGAFFSMDRHRYDGVTGLYYVDPVSGSDANPGSSASPYKTISKALAQTDVNGVSLAAGLYPGANWNSTYTRPERSFSIWCPSGTAIVSNAEDSVVNGWTLNTGSTYQTTRTAATTRVVDLTNRNAKGKPALLTSRASIALVDANPGSYFSDAGTSKVYVRTWDSRAPDVNVIVQIGTIKPRAAFSTANHFMMQENMTFVGSDCSQLSGSSQYDFAESGYYYKNVEHFYCTEWDHGNARDVCLENCTGINTDGDVFNHRSAIFIEVDCVGGESGAHQTDNCTTLHGTAHCFTLRGDYFTAPRVIHDIETSKRLIMDSDISGAYDNGTARTGTGIMAQEPGFSGASVMRQEVYYCRFSNNQNYDLRAGSDASVINVHGTNPASVLWIEDTGGDVVFQDVPVHIPVAMYSYRRRRAS